MSLLGPLLSTFGSARSTPSGNRSSINTTPFSRSTTTSETQDDSSNIPNQNRTTRKKKKRAWLGFGKEKLKEKPKDMLFGLAYLEVMVNQLCEDKHNFDAIKAKEKSVGCLCLSGSCLLLMGFCLDAAVVCV